LELSLEKDFLPLQNMLHVSSILPIICISFLVDLCNERIGKKLGTQNEELEEAWYAY